MVGQAIGGAITHQSLGLPVTHGSSSKIMVDRGGGKKTMVEHKREALVRQAGTGPSQITFTSLDHFPVAGTGPPRLDVTGTSPRPRLGSAADPPTKRSGHKLIPKRKSQPKKKAVAPCAVRPVRLKAPRGGQKKSTEKRFRKDRCSHGR
jgi:hypothetical protein